MDLVGGSTILGEQGVDVQDELKNEAVGDRARFLSEGVGSRTRNGNAVVTFPVRANGFSAGGSQHDQTFGSFVVSPHTEDFDGVFGVIELLHKTVLNVDAA